MALEIDYRTSEGALVPATPVEWEQNLAHGEEAVGHLIQFFRDGPRNQAIVQAAMAQVQELENVLWYIRSAFDVNTAVGEQLDYVGRRVGEYRDNRSDAEYRQAIRVRVLVNKSTGTLDDLVEIVYGLAPDAVVTSAEYQPAAVLIESDTFEDTSLATTHALLKRAKPGGVRLHLVLGVPATLGSPSGGGGVLGSVDGDPEGFELGAGA